MQKSGREGGGRVTGSHDEVYTMDYKGTAPEESSKYRSYRYRETESQRGSPV